MRGFIDDLDELTEAPLESELLLDVSNGNDSPGVVEAVEPPWVEGDCSLAIAVRHDRELADLRRVVCSTGSAVRDERRAICTGYRQVHQLKDATQLSRSRPRRRHPVRRTQQ